MVRVYRIISRFFGGNQSEVVIIFSKQTILNSPKILCFIGTRHLGTRGDCFSHVLINFLRQMLKLLMMSLMGEQ